MAVEAPPRANGAKAIWTLPALAFCGVTFLLLAYLCQSAQIVRSQYRIVAVRGEVRELQAEANDLELSVCELTALERIEKLATERLAMVVPTERRVIEVSWQKAIEKGSEVAALP
jgi:cell division protein FtsL